MNKLNAEYNLTRKRILIVEDEEPIRQFLVKVLETSGYEVTGVVNGMEALQSLATHAYDVILSDYKMPDMNGIAFYHKVCASAPEHSKGFILMTGAVLCPTVLQLVQERRVKVLPKPFLPDEVSRVVSEILLASRVGQGVHRLP